MEKKETTASEVSQMGERGGWIEGGREGGRNRRDEGGERDVNSCWQTYLCFSRY